MPTRMATMAGDAPSAAVAAAARAADTADAAGAEVDSLLPERVMIIETQDDVTAAVLAEMHRTPSPRTKELLALLVKHLHAFVREAKLTEREFQDAIGT